ALTAILVVFGLASIRAMPAGSGHERALSQDARISAAGVLPAVAVEASYPQGPERSPAPALIWPAPGPITSPFGGRRHHPGLDIDGVTGDPVAAAAGGTVVLPAAAPAGYSGYGNVVMIDHGGGIATLYAHLSRVDVTLGE